MAEQRFFWLKLKRDFFKRHDIMIIENMENGKDYILFYLKLLAESIDHEGHLRFNETIPYNEQMLSTITNTNIDVVRSACKIFLELNLMEKLDDGTIFMIESQRMIGSETSSAERVRNYRQNLKTLQCNTDVTKSNDHIDLELDKELDIDKELKKEESKPKRFTPPSIVELKTYITENSYNVDAQLFLDHYETINWYRGKNKIKCWKACVRTWNNREKKETVKKSGVAQWLESQEDV